MSIIEKINIKEKIFKSKSNSIVGEIGTYLEDNL